MISIILALSLGAACPGSSPGPRTSAAMTWDAARGVVLLFGGLSPDTAARYPGTLWAWNGTAWTCLSAAGPPGRQDAELAFDPARGVAVLYGGRQRIATGMRQLSDTWEWNGTAWSEKPDSAPGGRVHFVVAPVGGVDGVLMLGGAMDDDPAGWQWNGARWTKLTRTAPAGTIPNAMFPDASGRTVFLAVRPPQSGNAFAAELWRWGDAAWVRADSGGPGFSPRAAAAATAEGLLLYLGWEPDNAPAVAWTWGSAGWKRVRADPGRRRSGVMAYDARRRVTVLYGGDDGAAILGDLWEWDGHSWLRR